MSGPQLLVINTTSGLISRFVGRTRTHKPFNINEPLCGSAEHALFLEFCRTDPDSQGIEREPVHVS